jgi:hypothetical protein
MNKYFKKASNSVREPTTLALLVAFKFPEEEYAYHMRRD